MKLLGTKRLETDRLILRRLKLEDAREAYNNWCSKDEVTYYVPWQTHESVEVTKELFSLWESQYNDLSTFRWIVELKKTHELIGTIDVSNKEHINEGSLEIGYCYGPKYWGKGLATEALKAVVEYLFLECEMDTIYARHMSNNVGSGKVMMKAGLKYKGIENNMMIDKKGIKNEVVYYAISREDYLKNN